jgi:hypothetical protein
MSFVLENHSEDRIANLLDFFLSRGGTCPPQLFVIVLFFLTSSHGTSTKSMNAVLIAGADSPIESDIANTRNGYFVLFDEWFGEDVLGVAIALSYRCSAQCLTHIQRIDTRLRHSKEYFSTLFSFGKPMMAALGTMSGESVSAKPSQASPAHRAPQ